MNLPDKWDMEYDVVVAGYGFAGGWTAMSAHDHGASVAIFEKMPHFGGNSILSGGGFAAGTDYEGTLAYLRATCRDATDDAVLQAYARGMVEITDVVGQFAKEVGFETYVGRGGATYPFPGHEQFIKFLFRRNPSYKGFPWAPNATGGGLHMWILHEHIKRRGIPQYYNSPVRELIADGDGVVRGVVVEQNGERLCVRARRGVVLCSGGFEHNKQMIAHYLQIREAYSMSPLGNTGDGVAMAQKVGAGLWHMWHVHGSYGFKIPELPVALRTPFGGYRNDPARPTMQMPWIIVDRFSRRFMNEWPVACADTPIRELEYFDFDTLDYPRVPSFLIFDEEGRKRGPIARPLVNDEEMSKFSWSEDNLAEVEKGYIIRKESIQGIAAHWGLDPKTLSDTVVRWNEYCERGVDPDFGRTTANMMPIKTAPFYSIQTWPIITNTQGGPIHDEKQRVLDSFGKPIPGLYEAGELGSIWGHVYLLSGNIAECVIGGRIAGREAAERGPGGDDAPTRGALQYSGTAGT